MTSEAKTIYLVANYRMFLLPSKQIYQIVSWVSTEAGIKQNVSDGYNSFYQFSFSQLLSRPDLYEIHELMKFVTQSCVYVGTKFTIRIYSCIISAMKTFILCIVLITN